MLPAWSPLGIMMLLVSRNFWALTSFMPWEMYNCIGTVGAHLRGFSAALSLCPRQLLGVTLTRASGSPAGLGFARARRSTSVLQKERQQFRAEAEAPAAAELWSTTGPIPLNQILSSACSHTHSHLESPEAKGLMLQGWAELLRAAGRASQHPLTTHWGSNRLPLVTTFRLGTAAVVL